MTRWTEEVLPVLEAAYRVSLRDLTEPYVRVEAVH
jgi:hypothetical protein